VKEVSCTRNSKISYTCKAVIPGTRKSECTGKRAAGDPTVDEDGMTVKGSTERPEPAIKRAPRDVRRGH
jgi:hypothetical protein